MVNVSLALAHATGHSRTAHGISVDDALLERRRQVRSVLAIIRALVQRMSTSTVSTEEFAAHLNGRIGAIARMQEILMRPEHELVDLAELVEDELLSQGIASGRVLIPAEPLMVQQSVAAALALALHELTTNSIKFGALGNPPGSLDVHWAPGYGAEGWAVLKWQEESVRRDELPRQDGFGFELIRSILPYQIGARTSIERTPKGLVCHICFRPGIQAQACPRPNADT